MVDEDRKYAWILGEEKGRVAPRECVRAARDALNTAYSSTDERVIVPQLHSALDWMRRALEQYVPVGGQEEDPDG